MRQISRIFITDAEYKHTTALIKGIKSSYPQVNITGQVSSERNAIFASKLIDKVLVGTLEQTLEIDQYDLIIPVSGRATQLISELNMTEVFLATSKQINSALDKYELSKACNEYGIAYPKTQKLERMNDIQSFGFPCIIKSRNETQVKFDTIYLDCAQSFNKLRYQIERLLDKHPGLIVQERVRAKTSRGFFALCSNGKILCDFMHERVRQWPRSGGSSTSAKGIKCSQLQRISSDFLSDLNWTGPVMLEYLYDDVEGVYTLIEINPKFWGSLDLAINSGVNFGAAVLDAKSGKKVQKVNYKFVQTSWPLDGDVVNLVQTGDLKGLLSYFHQNHYLIWGESLKSIIVKFLWTLKKVFKFDGS